MSERNDKDLERTAEEALDRLARGWDPLSPSHSSGPAEETSATATSSSEDEALIASHLEAMSLLAYAVEPHAPSPELKQSILRAAAAEPKAPRPVAAPAQSSKTIQSSEPMPSAPVRASIPSDATVDAPVDVTLRHMVSGTREDPGDMTLVGLGAGESTSGPGLDVGDVRSFRPADEASQYTPTEYAPPPRAANSNVPLYLLAAGLVFCLIGLGYLYGQLQTQNAQNIARQADLQAQVQQARQDAESMRARVQMVTDVARTAYPMRQVSTGGGVRTGSRPDPGDVRPDGIVYVCGQHQRWYLSLSGFDPAPAGKVYHLWFKTADGAIDAGPLELTEDGRADVGDLSMPEGTQGFLVSLEDRIGPEGGVGREGSAEADGEPHGQIILRGDQPVKL